jgi:hypothetical protein
LWKLEGPNKQHCSNTPILQLELFNSTNLLNCCVGILIPPSQKSCPCRIWLVCRLFRDQYQVKCLFLEMKRHGKWVIEERGKSFPTPM